MAVEAIALDPIELTVDRLDRNLQSVGFYQREEDGWGDFLDREDLEYWNPVQLTSALTRFPGVRPWPILECPAGGSLHSAGAGPLAFRPSTSTVSGLVEAVTRPGSMTS